MRAFKFLLLIALSIGVLVACQKNDEIDEVNKQVNPDLKKGNPHYNMTRGNPHYNMIKGTSGDDVIDENWTPVPPGSDADKIICKDGDDFARGYEGDDFLIGGDGGDTLQGNIGNDILNGGGGDDQLEGGEGNDILKGGEGNDVLYGKNPASGTDGDDVLKGGEGDDWMDGNEGIDMLYGGLGDDVIFGGDHDDTAVFEGPYSTYTITDMGTYKEVSGPEGTDEINNDVEFLKFDDQTVPY